MVKLVDVIISIILGIILNYFVTSRAYTVIDAVIFIIMYTFVFSITINLVESFLIGINVLIGYKVNEKFITFFEFAEWGDAYNKCIATNKSLMIVDDRPTFIWSEPVITKTDLIVTFVILPIVAITSYVLLMIMAKKESAEKTSEISNSYFG